MFENQSWSAITSLCADKATIITYPKTNNTEENYFAIEDAAYLWLKSYFAKFDRLSHCCQFYFQFEILVMILNAFSSQDFCKMKYWSLNLIFTSSNSFYILQLKSSKCKDLSCPSVVGWQVAWSVGLSVIISQKGGKQDTHVPIGALVWSSTQDRQSQLVQSRHIRLRSRGMYN